jgi:ribonucleotide reductase alpha subunit
VHGTSSKDVMDLLVLNQYFDTLQQIGTHPGTRCVFLNGDTPEITKGILQGNAAKN